ncbi:MmgE/PrpD family protein, partial [Actinomadura bangladeshensis]
RVAEAGDLTARLPDERAARVTVELDDGTARTREVPNPVGDADHRPLGEADVRALLRGWLPGREHLVDRVAAFARVLPALDHVGERLRGLAGDETKEER